MISYFYSGKGRSQLKVCEDSLTSVVFDTLKFLPTPIFWEILKTSLVADKLPYASGELLSITFWDKWDANETTNSSFVEPDVFMRFHEFDIIIEAKRYNEKQQYWHQMISQIQAYSNEYEDDNKQLFYIKLGGLHHLKDEPDYVKDNKNVIICKTDWTRLLDSISNYLEKVKNNDSLMSASHIRILEDCINGFAIHQFYKKKWLAELKAHSINNHKILKNTFIYG